MILLGRFSRLDDDLFSGGDGFLRLLLSAPERPRLGLLRSAGRLEIGLYQHLLVFSLVRANSAVIFSLFD